MDCVPSSLFDRAASGCSCRYLADSLVRIASSTHYFVMAALGGGRPLRKRGPPRPRSGRLFLEQDHNSFQNAWMETRNWPGRPSDREIASTDGKDSLCARETSEVKKDTASKPAAARPVPGSVTAARSSVRTALEIFMRASGWTPFMVTLTCNPAWFKSSADAYFFCRKFRQTRAGASSA
jgi:hypothetical protein